MSIDHPHSGGEEPPRIKTFNEFASEMAELSTRAVALGTRIQAVRARKLTA